MITRDEAHRLVVERILQRNLVSHCVATEVIMRALAQRLGLADDDVQRWELAGLLHDLDYAETADDFERHGHVTADELRERIDAEMIHAILAHAGKAPRETLFDHALWCADPTTGFIVAAALIRPEKRLAAVEVSALMKRWKEKAFARGASREQMAGHEALGLDREEFLTICLTAMQARAEELGL
jgi:hypothetical protein